MLGHATPATPPQEQALGTKCDRYTLLLSSPFTGPLRSLRISRMEGVEPDPGAGQGTAQCPLSRREVALSSWSSRVEESIQQLKRPVPFQNRGLQHFPSRLWWEGCFGESGVHIDGGSWKTLDGRGEGGPGLRDWTRQDQRGWRMLGPRRGTLSLVCRLMAGAPPLVPPPTWTSPGVVEAAVPGEEAGLVTEARPVDPVQPPALGEAGGVAAGAAAPRLGAARQGPGPQPHQCAQRQPQGPHDQRSRGAGDATDLRNKRCAPRTAAAGERPETLSPARPCPRPPPPARPLPAGRVQPPPRPRWGERSPGAPPPPRGDRPGARGEAGAPGPQRPSSLAKAATVPVPKLSFLTSGDTLASGHCHCRARGRGMLRVQRVGLSDAVRAGHPDRPGTPALYLLLVPQGSLRIKEI